MKTACRLVAAFGVLLFAHGTSSAQLPIAPPPHLALDELVKEYQRLGLPIPSPKAELVRVTWEVGGKKQHFLALLKDSTTWGKARYTTHAELWPSPIPESEESVEPIPASLEGATPLAGISFAVQCKLRGWDDLAIAAYADIRNRDSETSSDLHPTIVQLRNVAWSFWYLSLGERQSDRNEALKHLRDLSEWNPKFLGWWEQTLLTDLERTVAPRRSKPGSVEALIDELTEYWIDPNDRTSEEGRAAYWALVELGFDAVPALLEHVNDQRLTRMRCRAMKTGEFHITRISNSVESILNAISGDRYEQEARAPLDERKPARDHKWWAEARKAGEEKWLIENVFSKSAGGREQVPNEVVLRVIQAKYPHRLQDVYRTAFKIAQSEDTVSTIVASQATREEKLARLETEASHNEYSRRHDALEALADIDAVVFRKHLLRTLKSIPKDTTFEQDVYNAEVGIAKLVRKTDDRSCWNALTDLTRRVAPGTRHYFLQAVTHHARPEEADPGRRECVRYLLGFLEDSAVGEVPWRGRQAVRDFATLQLAFLLGHITPEVERSLRSPREISLLRDRVRELAERELSQPAK